MNPKLSEHHFFSRLSVSLLSTSVCPDLGFTCSSSAAERVTNKGVRANYLLVCITLSKKVMLYTAVIHQEMSTAGGCL